MRSLFHITLILAASGLGFGIWPGAVDAGPKRMDSIPAMVAAEEATLQLAGAVIPIQAGDKGEGVEEAEKDAANRSRSDRSWLGVELQELDEGLREAFNIEGGSGVLVAQVVPGSPADKAGIDKGDVIVRVDGRTVHNPSEVVRRIRARDPGDRVEITRIRKGREKKVNVLLVEAPERLGTGSRDEGHWRAGSYLGARVEPLSGDLAPYFKLSSESGVLIIEVEDGSPAEQAGLKGGDVITKVDGKQVKSPEDLIRAIDDQEPGSRVKLTAFRQGTERQFETELAEEPARERLRRLARGDFEPMLHGLHSRMLEGRDAMAERIEKLEELIHELERRVDELGGRKDR